MRFLGVEAGRGVAALLVVMLHASDMLSGPRYLGRPPFGDLFRFGHAGVDFFFVLSGFIIFYVHRGDIGQAKRFSAFAWKRFVRIYPTYWVVLAMLGAMLVFSPTRDHAERDVFHVIASTFLLPDAALPILGVAWSLKHEILFYAIFGVLLFDRRAGGIALAGWGLLIAWNIVFTMWTGAPYFQGLAGSFLFRIFNMEFFFGMLVARLAMDGPARYPLAFLALGTVLFFASGLVEVWGPVVPIEWPPRHLAYATGAAMALYGLVGAEKAGRLRVPGMLTILGTASYSIYLLHLIVIMILQQGLLRLRPVLPMQPEVIFLAVVAVVVVVSVWFCRMVELPLLHALRRLPTRPGGQAAWNAGVGSDVH